MRQYEQGGGAALVMLCRVPPFFSPGTSGWPSAPSGRWRSPRPGPGWSWRRSRVRRVDGMEHPFAILPDMSVHGDIRDRNNPSIGLVAVEEAVGGPVAVARQGGVVPAVLVHPDRVVQLGVQGAAVHRERGRLRDVGDAAHIYLSKVNRFVPDGWRGRWQRGAAFFGVRVLYEEIAYIRMPPH